MAGFEIIVRPVVFPDIRPQATRSLPAEDDPEKGKCTIGGSGGGLIGVSYSSSMSASRASQKEKQRTVDEARVYQQDKNGKVNNENFVDIQVAKKIKMEVREKTSTSGSPPGGGGGGIGRIAGNVSIGGAWVSAGGTIETWNYQYRPVKSSSNVEILTTDQVIK